MPLATIVALVGPHLFPVYSYNSRIRARELVLPFMTSTFKMADLGKIILKNDANCEFSADFEAVIDRSEIILA